jgi:predicted PurR-regulated permease PerM
MGLLLALYSIRETLFIFILAIFFSYMMNPLVAFVDKHARGRASRVGSMGLVYLAVMAILMISLVAIGSQIVTEATRLASQLPSLIQNPDWLDRLPIPASLSSVKQQLGDSMRQQAASLSENALPVIRDVGLEAVSYAGNAVYVVLVPILSFMLSKDAPDIKRSLLEWLGDGPGRLLWEGVAEDLNVLLAGYIRALVLLSAATLVVFSVFLSIAGVPYSVLFGVLAAALEFIPMVGPLTAAGIVLVVAGFSGYPHMVVLATFFVLYRLFEDYVLSPYLMSSGVELSPILVIFGVLAGEHLGGVPAMFLSIPTMAAAKILATRLRGSVVVPES